MPSDNAKSPKTRQLIALRLERFARTSIPQRSSAFGQFMYHAELIRRGHIEIHRKDLASVPEKYRKALEDIVGG